MIEFASEAKSSKNRYLLGKKFSCEKALWVVEIYLQLCKPSKIQSNFVDTRIKNLKNSPSTRRKPSGEGRGNNLCTQKQGYFYICPNSKPYS